MKKLEQISVRMDELEQEILALRADRNADPEELLTVERELADYMVHTLEETSSLRNRVAVVASASPSTSRPSAICPAAICGWSCPSPRSTAIAVSASWT